MRNFVHEFIEACLRGDFHSWRRLQEGLQTEIAEKKKQSYRSIEKTEIVELELLERMASRFVTLRYGNIAGVLKARENGEAILKALAEVEMGGSARMAYGDLGVKLKMKKANLSMQLAHLEQHDIVRRVRDGRMTWVSLSPAARKYAMEQGWLANTQLLEPAARDFGNARLRTPLARPVDIWSGKVKGS